MPYINTVINNIEITYILCSLFLSHVACTLFLKFKPFTFNWYTLISCLHYFINTVLRNIRIVKMKEFHNMNCEWNVASLIDFKKSNKNNRILFFLHITNSELTLHVCVKRFFSNFLFLRVLLLLNFVFSFFFKFGPIKKIVCYANISQHCINKMMQARN